MIQNRFTTCSPRTVASRGRRSGITITSMLAFAHIHKTGGTTVGWTLRSAFGARHCEIIPIGATHVSPWESPATAADLKYAMRVYPRLRSIGGHYVQPHSDIYEAHPDLQFFTMVRDPLTMRASMYQHGVAALGPANISFEGWLAEEQSQNRLTRMIAGRVDVAAAIRIIEQRKVFVGLLDHFDESMVMFKAMHAPDMDIRYRRMRVALDSSVARDILTDQRSRSMLQEGLEADLELYDWISHEVYPRQEQAYGPSLEIDTADFQKTMASYRSTPISQNVFQKNPLAKTSILRDIRPFNRTKVMIFFGKKLGVYKPAVKIRAQLTAARRARDRSSTARTE